MNQRLCLYISLIAAGWPFGTPEASAQEAPALEGARIGQIRNDNSLKMKLVWIPPGHFKMGSPTDEWDRSTDEEQSQVTLTRGFWLGQTEITQSQWQRVMQTTPWSDGKYIQEGNDYPAMCLTWDDAMNFCKKLTDTERDAGRLAPAWKIRCRRRRSGSTHVARGQRRGSVSATINRNRK
jgi:formylglycine-generating enzyme required for sulfatase activity